MKLKYFFLTLLLFTIQAKFFGIPATKADVLWLSSQNITLLANGVEIISAGQVNSKFVLSSSHLYKNPTSISSHSPLQAIPFILTSTTPTTTTQSLWFHFKIVSTAEIPFSFAPQEVSGFLSSSNTTVPFYISLSSNFPSISTIQISLLLSNDVSGITLFNAVFSVPIVSSCSISSKFGESCEESLIISKPTLCPMEPIAVKYSFASRIIHDERLSITRLDENDGNQIVDLRYFDTWSTIYPIIDFRQNNTLSGERELFASTEIPGDYLVEVSIKGEKVYSFQLTIKPWSDAECSGGYLNETCSNSNDCSGSSCINGVCVCDAGTFSANCSKGLRSQINVTTAESGNISSGRYINGVKTAWLIEPINSEEISTIQILFDFVSLDRGDSLSIFKPSNQFNSTTIELEDAKGGELIGMFTGNQTPGEKISIATKRVLLVFVSDYCTTDKGFSLSYHVQRTLKSGWIALIVIGSVIFISIIVIVIVLTSIYKLNKHRSKKSISNTIYETMSNEEIEEATKVNMIQNWSQLEENGIRVNKNVCMFGLVAKSVFPLDEERTDQVYLTNTSGRSINFIASVPQGNRFTFTLRVWPGKGTIPPHSEISLTIAFNLHYTSRFSKRIKLQFFGDSNNKKSVGMSFLEIQVEGMLSDRLDPDDITLFTPPIAVGNFGTVYKGSYRSRIVAVKVLKRQQDLTEQEFEEFVTETDLYRRLRNPYIVEYVGASYVPSRLCLCTELLNRGNLEHLLHESDTPIPYLLILKFAQNISEAMAFLHANNVLYRDLKPANVLILSNLTSAQINCKLTDFGTAKNVENAAELFKHTAGQGTPIYMAPEVLATEGYNTKADVYSFGISLWEMFTRTTPWNHIVCWNVPKMVIEGQRPPIPENCPEDYSSIIQNCWKQNTKDRPSFHELVGAISLIVHNQKRKERIIIPPPQRTAEQLREMQLARDMDELDRVSALPNNNNSSSNKKSNGGDNGHFRSQQSSESGHTRTQSLDGREIGKLELPSVTQTIRIKKTRANSTRSLIGLLVEEQAKEALGGSSIPQHIPNNEAEKKKKQQQQKHTKHKKHTKQKIHDESQASNQICPISPITSPSQQQQQQQQAGIELIPLVSTNSSPTPNSNQTPPINSPPIPIIASPSFDESQKQKQDQTATTTAATATNALEEKLTPEAADPNMSNEQTKTKAENLLMRKRPVRRRPSWDLGDLADTAAFKKIENRQFNSFRRGRTITAELIVPPQEEATSEKQDN